MAHRLAAERLAFPFFLSFFLCVVFFFGQPVTAILVLWLMTRPFWPTISVGIFSVPLHRFPFAVNAGYWRCGNVSSKLVKGTSGAVANVAVVIPALLMNVSPCTWTVTPFSPVRTTISSGYFAPP